MPQLLLFRHGKSSWDENGLADSERPLSARGRRDVASMAALIATDYRPDRILCSPSRRTRETLAALLPLLADEPAVVIEDALYGSDGDYRDVIAADGGDAERLLVIGHNPAIQATALVLATSGGKALRAEMAAKFPTAALAVIRVDDAWFEIARARGRLVAFHRPRDLASGDNH